MNSKHGFYGLPRDGQIAEERLCDAPSAVLKVAPGIESRMDEREEIELRLGW